jgi:hypothetical protein
MTSSGLYNQNQLIANLTLKVTSAVSLVSSYTLNRALSNTDGLSTFPGNPYDFAGEYGPASTDIRHRLSVSGTINMRWALRLNPLVSYQSGSPYNITAGDDPYGTSLFSARPGLATDSTRPGLVQTGLGLLDPNPISSETLIGRNAGRGPAQVLVNLRATKTWGVGPEKPADGNSGGKPHSFLSNAPATRRYNISLGMSSQNLLNHDNPGTITGNITSPLFGRANQVAGRINGEGFSENASNRRLELQVRFVY